MSKFAKYLIGFTVKPKSKVKTEPKKVEKKAKKKIYSCPREAEAREKNRLRCLAYYHKNKALKKDQEND